MIITALKPTKNKTRLNLYLDNRFIISLDPELVLSQGLKLNQTITQSQLDQLISAAYLAKLYSKALNLLSFRPRSVKEINSKLNLYLKKISSLTGPAGSKLINQTIAKLKQQKLLDDQQFVDWWFNQRSTHKPKGNLALKAELWQKGISRDLINQALLTPVQEKQLALKLSRRRLSKISSLPYQFKKTKLIQFLRQRGFTSSTIFSVVDELIPKE